MAESNSAGALAVRHDQDAFGIVQEAWDTGLPKSAPSGWHHNTKIIDPDSGMVYMYQRWYNPHTGTFLSKAPYPVHVEHAYGFAINLPNSVLDSDGGFPGIAGPVPGMFPPVTPPPGASPPQPCKTAKDCLKEGCAAARGDNVVMSPKEAYCTALLQCLNTPPGDTFGAAVAACVKRLEKDKKKNGLGIVEKCVKAGF